MRKQSTNIKLIKRAKKKFISITQDSRNGKSQTTKYRKFADINASMNSNAQQFNENFANSWMNFQFRQNPQILKQNKFIQKYSEKEFNRKSRQLWKEYKKDCERITNQTFNAVKRTLSLRDLQETRISVCLIIFKIA